MQDKLHGWHAVGKLACNSNAIRMQFSPVIYDQLNGRIEELRFYDSGLQGPTQAATAVAS